MILDVLAAVARKDCDDRHRGRPRGKPRRGQKTTTRGVLPPSMLRPCGGSIRVACAQTTSRSILGSVGPASTGHLSRCTLRYEYGARSTHGGAGGR